RLQAVRAQAFGGRRAGAPVTLQDVASAVRLARCRRKEAGRGQRMHRARQHALLLAVALRCVLDRAQVAFHVKRVDAVLPLLARRLLVRVRQHRLGERGRDLQISSLRGEPRRQESDEGRGVRQGGGRREASRRGGKIVQVGRLQKPEQKAHLPLVWTLAQPLFQDLDRVQG